MKYFYTDEKGEKVEEQQERWSWQVVFRDGAVFSQFEPDGTFHRFAQINQQNVDVFRMVHIADSEDEPQSIDLVIRPDMQIFHFYKNFVLDIGTEGQRRERIYCFGWKAHQDGSKLYVYILPDDRIVMAPQDLELTL